jgi:Zn-dependent alcohol dehydrogenase
VLVGVPPAGRQEIGLDLYDMVVSEKELVGSFNGSYSLPLAIPRLAELAARGDLQLDPLITDSRPLTELNEAMHALETGTGIRQIIRP